MPLGMEVGFGPGDMLLDGDPAPSPQKGAGAPKFSAHVDCGQTAGWIKMVLGMEVGLSPGDFVLDGDPVGQLLPEKPGQNSGQANCGIFRLATVCCLLCESYTQLHHREKSYNSKLN